MTFATIALIFAAHCGGAIASATKRNLGTSRFLPPASKQTVLRAGGRAFRFPRI
jgi:hypothetical protein